MDQIDKRLLNDFQRDLALNSRPYAVLAKALGISESDVLMRLRGLLAQGLISRVGAVFAPRRIGTSTLAAMALPPEQLDSVAALVNSYQEVNHNYAREHHYNLWFVITACDQDQLDRVIADIAQRSGFAVMSLPLEKAFHIDLGFPMALS